MRRLLSFGMRAARIPFALWVIYSTLFTVYMPLELSTAPANVLTKLPVAHASVTYVLPITKYAAEPMKQVLEHINVNRITDTIKAYKPSWGCEILPAESHSWGPRRIKCSRYEDVAPDPDPGSAAQPAPPPPPPPRIHDCSADDPNWVAGVTLPGYQTRNCRPTYGEWRPEEIHHSVSTYDGCSIMDPKYKVWLSGGPMPWYATCTHPLKTWQPISMDQNGKGTSRTSGLLFGLPRIDPRNRGLKIPATFRPCTKGSSRIVIIVGGYVNEFCPWDNSGTVEPMDNSEHLWIPKASPVAVEPVVHHDAVTVAVPTQTRSAQSAVFTVSAPALAIQSAVQQAEPQLEAESVTAALPSPTPPVQSAVFTVSAPAPAVQQAEPQLEKEEKEHVMEVVPAIKTAVPPVNPPAKATSVPVTLPGNVARPQTQGTLGYLVWFVSLVLLNMIVGTLLRDYWKPWFTKAKNLLFFMGRCLWSFGILLLKSRLPHCVASCLVSFGTRLVNLVPGLASECIRAARGMIALSMTGLAWCITRLPSAAKDLVSFVTATFGTRIASFGTVLDRFATCLDRFTTWLTLTASDLLSFAIAWLLPRLALLIIRLMPIVTSAALMIYTVCLDLARLLLDAWVAWQASRVPAPVTGASSFDIANARFRQRHYRTSSNLGSLRASASTGCFQLVRIDSSRSYGIPKSTSCPAVMELHGTPLVNDAGSSGTRSINSQASSDTDWDSAHSHSSGSWVQRAMRKASQRMSLSQARPRHSSVTPAIEAETENQSLANQSTSEGAANWSRRSGSSYIGSASGSETSWAPSNEMDRSSDSNNTAVNVERARRRVRNRTPFPGRDRLNHANWHYAHTPGEVVENSHDSDDSAHSSTASSVRASSGCPSEHSLTDMDIETPPKWEIPSIDHDNGDSGEDPDGSEKGQKSRYISFGNSDGEPDFSNQRWRSSPKKRAQPMRTLTASLLANPSPQERCKANIVGLPVLRLGPEHNKKEIKAEVARLVARGTAGTSSDTMSEHAARDSPRNPFLDSADRINTSASFERDRAAGEQAFRTLRTVELPAHLQLPPNTATHAVFTPPEMTANLLQGGSPYELGETHRGTLKYKALEPNRVVTLRGRKPWPTAFDTPEVKPAADQVDKENVTPAPLSGPSSYIDRLRPLPSRTKTTPSLTVTPASPVRAPVVTTASPAGPWNPVVIEETAPSTAIIAEDSRHVGNDSIAEGGSVGDLIDLNFG